MAAARTLSPTSDSANNMTAQPQQHVVLTDAGSVCSLAENLHSTLVLCSGQSVFLNGDCKSPDLSVVVPTFNEVQNLGTLLSNLDRALCQINWEVIFVDDNSPDCTAAFAKLHAQSDRRIRCIRRIGRRGLAGACIEGMLSSSSPFVAVLDGDLQHDETVLPHMLSILQRSGGDLVIGTRHKKGGSAEGLTKVRRYLSSAGSLLSKLVLRSEISDPMSGFFMIRRDLIEEVAPKLSTDGFKILADILVSSPLPLKIEEVIYTFRARQAGQSKLSGAVLLQYGGFILHRLTKGLVPVRFLMFGLVGASGLIVHMATLNEVLKDFNSVDFWAAEAIATFVAMVSNFFLNNWVTYWDLRHRGFSLFPAFIAFCAVCSVGALSNISMASWVYAGQKPWWIAGLAGALTGAFWNYGISSGFVWSERFRDFLECFRVNLVRLGRRRKGSHNLHA